MRDTVNSENSRLAVHQKTFLAALTIAFALALVSHAASAQTYNVIYR
jgi:hypothetical protein